MENSEMLASCLCVLTSSCLSSLFFDSIAKVSTTTASERPGCGVEATKEKTKKGGLTIDSISRFIVRFISMPMAPSS